MFLKILKTVRFIKNDIKGNYIPFLYQCFTQLKNIYKKDVSL